MRKKKRNRWKRKQWDNKKQNQCNRKRWYPNEDEAKNAAEIMNIRNFGTKDSKRLVHHYECPKCSKWHIGHKRKVNNEDYQRNSTWLE